MVHSLNSSIVFGTGLDQQVKQLARITAPYRYQVVRKHSSTEQSGWDGQNMTSKLISNSTLHFKT